MAQNAHTVAPVTINMRSSRTSLSVPPMAKLVIPAINPIILIKFAGVNPRKKIITKLTQN